jgi:hypothetical protein
MADETETPTTDALAPDPTKTVTTANTQSTSEVTKPDPLLIASLTAQNDQAKAAAQAAEEAGAAKAAGAADVAGAQEEASKETLAAGEDVAAQQQREQDMLAEAKALHSADVAEAKGQKFHDYFHDASGERKTGRSVLTALGAIFGGLSGSPQAMQAINDSVKNAINSDFERQRVEYAQKLDAARASGENVDSLERQFNREMARLSTRQQLAHEAAAQHVEAIASRSGSAADMAAAKQTAAQLRAEAARSAVSATSHLGKTVRYSKNTSTQTTDDELGLAKLAAKGGGKAPDETDVVRDENGIPRWHVQKGRGGVVGFTQQDAAIKNAVDALSTLKASGKTIPSSALYKNPEYDNARIALGGVSALGKNEEALEAESGTLRSGLLGRIDPAAIDAKIAELTARRETNRKESLRPLTPDELRAFGVAGPGQTAMVTPGATPAMTDADAVRMIQAHQSGDSRFDSILRARGLLQ